MFLCRLHIVFQRVGLYPVYSWTRPVSNFVHVNSIPNLNCPVSCCFSIASTAVSVNQFSHLSSVEFEINCGAETNETYYLPANENSNRNN